MIVERELKVLGFSRAKVRAALKRLRAKKRFSGLLKVHYFDFPDGRIRKSDRLLRLRQFSNKKNELVFKEKIQGGKKVKSRKEWETTVNDIEVMKGVFKQIGLTQTKYYEKKRESYQIGKTKIEIDTYRNTFFYLEIEAPTVKEIEAMIKKLGLSDCERSTLTVNQLFKERFPDLPLNNLRF